MFEAASTSSFIPELDDGSHSKRAAASRGSQKQFPRPSTEIAATTGTKPGRAVLEGAFQLLEALSWLDTAGLAQLTRTSGLPKATVHRLLDQLVGLGAVERVSGGYRVGPAIGRLGNAERSHSWLRRASHGPCLTLTAATRAAVAVAVLHEKPFVCVRGIAASDSTLVGPGMYGPPATAAGQVLLAERPELGPPPPFTDDEWRRVRADIRRRGVAYDIQSFVRGICCVAAAVRLPDGRPVASVAAVLAAETIPAGVADLVRRAALEIGRNIGRARWAAEFPVR